jgi:hypothetical protein
MRYYDSNGTASVVFTGEPGAEPWKTENVGVAGPGAVFDLHPHLGSNQGLPSIADLLTSAKDGIPGVLVVPNASQTGFHFVFYQGHCIAASKGC